MTDGGWGHSESPFHAGEQQVQERLGVREKIEAFARRVVRDYMPDQHRVFYAQLPFVLLGTVDDRGRPWASLVAGLPGFMTSPDPDTLDVAVRPLVGDPLNVTLKAGADIGLLGIEPATRRRNRLTGRIASVRPDGFAISIRQAFGNCPQYIQTRDIEILPEVDQSDAARPVTRSTTFDDRTRELINSADTLFVATVYAESAEAASQGADVSHRGGKPGFVRIEDDRSFVFPDFSGNNHFNTVGNMLLNPKAGFLFIDFETRDLVYMTGTGNIVWEGEEVRAFAGAERLIRFQAEEVVRVESSLPLNFNFGEYSPTLDHTGSWTQTLETIAAERERNVYLPYEVFDVKPESAAITSFYLRRVDGKAAASYQPGQFLPIRLAIPGEAEPAMRTYTISDAPNADYYRLSIKREGGTALVSNYLHAHAEPGLQLKAMAPRGKFVLDQSSHRPVVLISAGVGVTPMIAMANFIISEGHRTRNYRPTYWIHGARNGREHAFGGDIHELAAKYESLAAYVCYSRPDEDDRLGERYDSEGRIDVELLKRILPFDDYDFYLCGPAPFMQALYDGLIGVGVRENRIHYESFGPATVLKHNAAPGPRPAHGETAEGPVKVGFAGSGIDATWMPENGTLLELAEAEGLNPAFSCRTGICGTCATRIKCGSVDYLDAPTAPHDEDEVLICCATPRSASGESTCGEDRGVVLEL